MKNILLLFLFIGIISCSEKESDLTVIGHVKDLKKGTLYLQKHQDTALVIVDSVEISGDSKFELHTSLSEPEIFYLLLDKNDNDEGRLKFFANKGVTEINTSLKNFVFDAQIKGSEQQRIYQEYNTISDKYKSKNLDLIKENFEALRNEDSIKASATQKEFENLIKRKYLYTINFALNNRTSQVSPYLALTEVYDAQLKYLDTIYVSLPDSIAKSKYGKELKTYIEERKTNELK